MICDHAFKLPDFPVRWKPPFAVWLTDNSGREPLLLLDEACHGYNADIIYYFYLKYIGYWHKPSNKKILQLELHMLGYPQQSIKRYRLARPNARIRSLPIKV